MNGSSDKKPVCVECGEGSSDSNPNCLFLVSRKYEFESWMPVIHPSHGFVVLSFEDKSHPEVILTEEDRSEVELDEGDKVGLMCDACFDEILSSSDPDLDY